MAVYVITVTPNTQDRNYSETVDVPTLHDALMHAETMIGGCTVGEGSVTVSEPAPNACWDIPVRVARVTSGPIRWQFPRY